MPKARVSIDVVESAFSNPAVVLPDRTGNEEERFNLVGITKQDRGIFVVFTIRTRGDLRLIRPISARYMHQRERRTYERTKKA